MAIYEVFSRPVLIKHKATICSNTTLFFVVTTFIKFICPFLVTYYSQGFWRKIDFYREQPDISFKHEMLIILETKPPDQLIFWSTYDNVNKVMNKKFLQTLPAIEHHEEDYNKDGKKDELKMSIEVPLLKQEIVSVKIILIFDYRLHLYSDFRMESAAYIYHDSSLPGAEFNVIGDLVLFQKESLRHTGKDERFNVPIIKNSNVESPTNLENIVHEYVQRNITTAFTNLYPVWKTGRAENQSFIINIFIKYPTETILYTVGFWQLLKWAVIQYISVFIIFSFVIHVIRKNVFQHQYLSTIIMNPFKQKV